MHALEQSYKHQDVRPLTDPNQAHKLSIYTLFETRPSETFSGRANCAATMAFVLKALPLLTILLSCTHASPGGLGDVARGENQSPNPATQPLVYLKPAKAETYLVAFKNGKKYVSGLSLVVFG